MSDQSLRNRAKRVPVERDNPSSAHEFKGFSKQSSTINTRRIDRDFYSHKAMSNSSQTGISRVASTELSIPSISTLDVRISSQGKPFLNQDLHRTVSPRLFPDISHASRIKVKNEPKNPTSLPYSQSNISPLTDHNTIPLQISNIGLKNLGNTCFMNSALQCLIHLEPLVSYFLKGSYRGDINLGSPFKGALATSFADLAAEMYSDSSGSVIVPTNFKKIVTKLAPHLLDYDQQDCQEFLRFLLDGLSEDLKRIQALTELSDEVLIQEDQNDPVPTPPSPLGQKRFSARTIERIRQHSISSQRDLKPTGGIQTSNNVTLETPHKPQETEMVETPAEGENPKLIIVKEMATIRTLQQKSRLRKSDSLQNLDNSPAESESTKPSPSESQQAWRHYLAKNDSIITEVFGGQLQSSIECLTCHHKSFCFDPFLDLSLPLGSGLSKCTVESCLESFSASEFLEGDNAYFCEKCKEKQRCVKRLNISKCPQILVIQIKRFRYNSIRREKMVTDVDFPMLNLDLSPYLTTELARQDSSYSYLYDLVAVAHHSGTLNGGHYIAHVDTVDLSVATSDTRPQNWMCYNDSRVTPASASSICGPSAYILFYRLKAHSS